MLQLARSEERSSEALLSLDSGNGLTWQSVTKQEENCVACPIERQCNKLGCIQPLSRCVKSASRYTAVPPF